MMESWLGLWILLLVIGTGVLMLLYARLLRELEQRNPEEYEALGRPSLFMLSPGRSLQFQAFVYSGSRQQHIAPEVARLCLLLAILTPLFVLAIGLMFAWNVSLTTAADAAFYQLGPD